MRVCFSGLTGLNKWLAVLLAAFLMIGSVCLPAPSALASRMAFGFAPQTYKSGYTYGNGVYFAPYDFTLYSKPDETAPMIGRFHWSRRTGTNTVTMATSDGNKRAVYADRVFFCFYPSLDVAMMAVTGDTDDGWAEVVYDQEKHQTGWVHLKAATKTADATTDGHSLAPLETGEPAHFGLYQTWQEFMKLNAKASGIYWLSGVSEYQRSVRSSDADEAKLIPITIIRQLKVKHVRGNWLLVEVLDFERNTPLGWVRWRDDNGNLMVFPNISGDHLPIVTTAY